ncbi:MAG: hypothetical protein JNL98_18780 [Bryobacterales bacterium]|nr:hypothetical protein [Bryobacterales bacterium]
MLVSEQSKEDAVRGLVASLTFHRADVLKALLEYLLAQDALGRSHLVTEAEIALKVMGRGPSFSPESDSSVRTRFAALRKKLDEYYSGEGRDCPVRVDIPRGTYTLRFLSHAPMPAAELEVAVPSIVPVQVEPVAVSADRSARRFFVWGALTGVCAVLLAGAVWAMAVRYPGSRESRLLAKAWGPMIEPGASVTIAIGTPASFFIRDFGDAPAPIGDPPYRLTIARDPELEDWYKRTRNATLGKMFILHPNAHAPLWGDAAAAGVLARMFGAHSAQVDQLPSARVHPVALRDRNAVIIGRPEYTDAARALIPEDGLSVEYSASERKVGVHNRKPKTGEPEWWFSQGGLRHNYGLVTVLSTVGEARRRMVLLSGINSDGAEAGARFFTSPDKLQDLDNQFRQAGFERWPDRFQVVVRTESMDTYSLETKFEFLRTLK